MIPTLLFGSIALVGCDSPSSISNTDQNVSYYSGNSRPFYDVSEFVRLDTIGCPGGTLLGIIPIFSTNVTGIEDIEDRLRNLSYAKNVYSVPYDWSISQKATKETNLTKEVIEAWQIYRKTLTASGKQNATSLQELWDLYGNFDINNQAIELPSLSIERVANDLVDVGIITSAGQPPTECGPTDNLILSVVNPTVDPKNNFNKIVQDLREKLYSKLSSNFSSEAFSISEVGRSETTAGGIPTTFPVVDFLIVIPSEALTDVNSQWLRTNIVMQTLGYNVDQGLLVNIYADNARAAAKTIRTTPPTQEFFTFDLENQEAEIAVRVADIIRDD